MRHQRRISRRVYKASPLCVLQLTPPLPPVCAQAAVQWTAARTMPAASSDRPLMTLDIYEDEGRSGFAATACEAQKPAAQLRTAVRTSFLARNVARGCADVFSSDIECFATSAAKLWAQTNKLTYQYDHCQRPAAVATRVRCTAWLHYKTMQCLRTGNSELTLHLTDSVNKSQEEMSFEEQRARLWSAHHDCSSPAEHCSLTQSDLVVRRPGAGSTLPVGRQGKHT